MCLKSLVEYHNAVFLFILCPFAKNCWSQLGVVIPARLRPERATQFVKRVLGVPFAMEIIILMCWCIWKEHNAWLFNNEDPSVEHCKIIFKREFALVIHRVKESLVRDIKSWLDNLV
jgi:hypothetical protein